MTNRKLAHIVDALQRWGATSLAASFRIGVGLGVGVTSALVFNLADRRLTHPVDALEGRTPTGLTA